MTLYRNDFSILLVDLSFSMYLKIKPVSLIFFTIWPMIYSIALYLIHVKIAFIKFLFTPIKFSFAMFESLKVLPNIFCAIFPMFFANSILKVVQKLSLYIANFLYQNSVAICLTVFELPFIGISVWVYESSISMRLSKHPLSLVARAILVYQHTRSLLNIRDQLAIVNKYLSLMLVDVENIINIIIIYNFMLVWQSVVPWLLCMNFYVLCC